MAKFIIMVMLMIFSMAKLTFAASMNEAEVRLVCALSSMASYNDDNGFLVREILKSYKWNIEVINDETTKANTKALIVTKRLEDGSLMKVLSICGTDDIKDAEVDFRLKQVPADINSESKINIEAEDYKTLDEDADKILVHQGFKDYADVILSNNFGTNLVNEMNANPNERLYITGHSLGGAVAIVMAAKLSNLNIANDRVEVITFGAPAAGNKGFANEYNNKIHLTRITVSGDPIKKSLQMLGYVHFGEVVKYKPNFSKVEHFPHKMAVYLDCALRDFYDYKLSNNQLYTHENNDKLIYVAPMQIMKDSFTEEDFKYVKAIISDQMKLQLTSAVFDEAEFREVEEVDDLADFDNSITEILPRAKAANCQQILVQYLQAKKIKTDKFGDYRVSLEEIIYDLKGSPISMQTASITTKELTLLEAAIFVQEKLIDNIKSLSEQ